MQLFSGKNESKNNGDGIDDYRPLAKSLYGTDNELLDTIRDRENVDSVAIREADKFMSHLLKTSIPLHVKELLDSGNIPEHIPINESNVHIDKDRVWLKTEFLVNYIEMLCEDKLKELLLDYFKSQQAQIVRLERKLKSKGVDHESTSKKRANRKREKLPGGVPAAFKKVFKA